MQPVNGAPDRIDCPICRNPAPTGTPPHQHLAGQTQITYTLHHCPDCELKFWSPLEVVPEVYVEEGFAAYVDYHAGTRPFPRWSEPLFHTELASGGKSLDIGCGDGAVMARLAGIGFEAHGIDLDEKSISVARSKYGMSLARTMTLDDYMVECERTQLRFDLITLFEVLEHQVDPLDFLLKLSRLGLAGGRVAGSVPNRERFLASLDRKLSEGDLPPHHFLWFSSSALAHLLSSAGLSNIVVERTGALPYTTLVGKVSAALQRQCARFPLPRVWQFTCRLIAPLAALVPWLGNRMAPSHLYFSAMVPGRSID